jgi:hypothetical protein
VTVVWECHHILVDSTQLLVRVLPLYNRKSRLFQKGVFGHGLGIEIVSVSVRGVAHRTRAAASRWQK